LKFLSGALAEHLAENEPVFYSGEKYWFYENGVYRRHDEIVAQRKVRSFMDGRYAKFGEICDTESQWKILIHKTTREINVNPFLVNFENGLYNLLTKEFIPHSPKILSTVRIGGNYNKGAKCPVFMKFLNDLLPQSEHHLIQEMLGYLLVPITKCQKAFVFVGKPNSGKSTLLYVVQELLLGKENVSNLTWQTLDDRFATAMLFGMLANIFSDLPNKAIQETGIFKSITGEDWITGQHKFKEYFSFKPFVRLLFSCNQIPKNYADGADADGFYRRLCIFRCDNVVPPEKKDEFLKEKLAAEVDGIIAWAMEGLERLMERNFRFPETDRTRAELNHYKTNNSTTLAFIEDCCKIESSASILRTELYDAYIEYCNDNGHKPSSQKKFNAELDNKVGINRANDPKSRRNLWHGICLA